MRIKRNIGNLESKLTERLNRKKQKKMKKGSKPRQLVEEMKKVEEPREEGDVHHLTTERSI